MAEHDEKKIDVAYVANLARMYLTEQEESMFQKQLNDIVRYVAEIEGVDVDGVEPMAHALSVQNVFRPDEEKKGLDRDTVLSNAPLHDGAQFQVPKII